MKIYLDNCCFNRPYDSQAAERIKLETEAKLYIQRLVMEGKLALVWSFMLDYENSASPYPDQREAIGQWKDVARQYIPALEKVRERGSAIEVATGIKPKDALHLACDVEADSDYFITTDRSFLKRSQVVKEVQALNPIDLVLILEDSR